MVGCASRSPVAFRGVILMVLLQRVAEGRLQNARMAPRNGVFHQVLRLRGGKKRPLDWDPRGQKEIFGHDDDEVDLEDPDFRGVFGWGKTEKDYNLPVGDRQWDSFSDSTSDTWGKLKREDIAGFPEEYDDIAKMPPPDPSDFWTNRSIENGCFFNERGEWIEDYPGQLDDMREGRQSVRVKPPPWEHTYRSDSEDERLFWGLDHTVDPNDQEANKVFTDPAITARFLQRAKLRMPWRFYPDHPAYTPDLVEELESQLQEKGVAKGSPYFADVAYNRARRERRRRLIMSKKKAENAATVPSSAAAPHQHSSASGAELRSPGSQVVGSVPGIRSAESEPREEESRALTTPSTIEGALVEGVQCLPHEGALLEGVQPLTRQPLDVSGPVDALYVVLETNLGSMSVELFWKYSPKTCLNFATLAARGYYDGTKFHKLIPQWVVQGGDPTGSGGRGGESIYGEFFQDEIARGKDGQPFVKHDRPGIVSMSNLGIPNTSASQFFITLAPDADLDGHHNVVGRICQGIKVLEIISMCKVDDKDVPVDNLIVERARPSMSPAHGDGIFDRDMYEEVMGLKNSIMRMERAAQGLQNMGT